MTLYKEILQQPNTLKEMYSNNREKIISIADELGPIEGVMVAARGTSDNVARYAKYVWGVFNRMPVTLATPSLFNLYKKPPRLNKILVLGISQSGQSPDIIEVIRQGKKQNCPTMAITNDITSPLANEADYVIDIKAGSEKAVAASKTYTAQLQSVAMLSAAWGNDEKMWEEIEKIPGWSSKILEQIEVVRESTSRYKYMDRCVVLGRGFNYATAYEWSLKLKELTYIMAEPYSSADFLHGPIAVVSTGFPIFAISPKGEVFDEMFSLLTELKENHGADLFIISDHEKALDIADIAIPLPDDIPEWLTPIIGILPAQLFCHGLAKIKGFDPDKPRGLTKVTRTR